MTNPTILFENDDVVVIDKPSGLAVHENGVTKVPTIVAWFLSHAPEAHGVGEPQRDQNGHELERSGVVHRLDVATSGVMILAKTQSAFEHLKAEFHERCVKKEYRAFVYGALKETWGTIERRIGRNARDFRLRSAERGAKGTLRDAVTNWECITTGTYNGEPFSEVRLLPKTGRTHQLRVHLKAIDHPIVCDELYAGVRPEKSNNLGLSRLALHAHILTITLPNSETHTFIAPLPQEFSEASAHIAPEV